VTEVPNKFTKNETVSVVLPILIQVPRTDIIENGGGKVETCILLVIS
jgi:hypothetical protein